MKIYNQDKTIQLKEENLDYSKGQLVNDTLVVDGKETNIFIFKPFTKEDIEKATKQQEYYNRVDTIQSRLYKLNQDIIQDLVGETVPNIADRKSEFILLHNELRVLTGKEPRAVTEI